MSKLDTLYSGFVGILNVGDGDTKLSFDPSNPAERIRAARIVKDMLRRGYALLVEVERDGQKIFERALDFREDTCEYIIADFDPTVEEPEGEDQTEQGEQPAEKKAQAKSGRKGVKADSTRAVAVARTSGG